jgi:hypothetical protein
MGTTRTLILALIFVLLTPATIPNAQPSGIDWESPGSHTSDTTTLSPDRAQETPSSASDSPMRIEWRGSTIYAERSSQFNIAVGALELFLRHGLMLPDLTIEMRSPNGCPKSGGTGDIAGSTSWPNGETWIKICGGVQTLYHELGHAWDRHNLTGEERRRYLELRGLAHWSNGEWDQRGGEHLAETFSWALTGQLGQPSRIPNNSLCKLRAGYQQLTGDEPPVLETRQALMKQCQRTTTPGGTLLHSTDLEPGSDLG